MLTYKAAYRFLDDGVHAEGLDYPGVITCGSTIEEARRLLASALVDMAESDRHRGAPLPLPDPTCTDTGADLDEPVHLIRTAPTGSRGTSETDVRV